MRKEVPKIICPRCHADFQTAQDLKNHLRQLQGCPISEDGADTDDPEIDPEDGITTDVRDILSLRKRKGQVVSWEALWELLFPDDQEVLSPGKHFKHCIPNHEASCSC